MLRAVEFELSAKGFELDFSLSEVGYVVQLKKKDSELMGQTIWFSKNDKEGIIGEISLIQAYRGKENKGVATITTGSSLLQMCENCDIQNVYSSVISNISKRILKNFGLQVVKYNKLSSTWVLQGRIDPDFILDKLYQKIERIDENLVSLI